MCHKMSIQEETSTEPVKAKISFSVESLLSSSKEDKIELEDKNFDDIDKCIEEEEISEDDEQIEVDDVDSRESSSSPGSNQLVVPQPLHPTVARGIFTPQWPFSWIGPSGPVFRSSSPQCKYPLKIFHFFTLSTYFYQTFRIYIIQPRYMLQLLRQITFFN